ncbi:sulfatase, partial [candidate division KSB1 bacterium]|nr:sulfatase [candidate division KSB1 bacterium]
MQDQNFPRRHFLRTAGLLSLSWLTVGRSVSSPVKRPNILFIAVDDLRPQLNCYGHKQMISPNIDRLAAEGFLFERAYCQIAVCGASRASLLSGIRPTEDRFLYYHDRVTEQAPGVTTLPMYLKNNGYTTISNGKIYHHIDDDIHAWSEKPFRIKGEHQFFNAENIKIHAENQQRTGGSGNNSRGPAFECAEAPEEKFPDHIMTTKTIEDLKRLEKSDEPFFLAAGFVRPHLPFNAPKKYWDMYDQKKIDLADNPFRPKGAPDVAIHNWGELRAYHNIPETGPVDEETARNMVHGYYASTSFVDAQIGRLLKALDDLHLAENTIVILWGDHGWQLGEHGMWCKHCNFETSVHVPLIIRVPGFKPGQRSDHLVEFVDIYPSLCQLAGLPLPPHLEGTSFVPLLKDP